MSDTYLLKITRSAPPPLDVVRREGRPRFTDDRRMRILDEVRKHPNEWFRVMTYSPEERNMAGRDQSWWHRRDDAVCVMRTFMEDGEKVIGLWLKSVPGEDVTDED